MELSQVIEVGENVSKCGYCGSKDTWHSCGLWALQLSNTHYQELIDRGWRRSGQYLYKPDLKLSCCAPYTIRLDVNNFKASKSQRKVKDRFQKFLDGKWAPTVKRAATLPRQRTRAPDASGSDSEDEHVTAQKEQEPSEPAAPDYSVRTAHRLTVTTLPAEFRQEAYEVYRKYQIHVHGDKPEKVTPQSYTRFLCTNPLMVEKRDGVEYGAFHMEYRIDDRLIMVGVVDILPACLSSVYLFYDPSLGFLSPGTLSAMLEIEWVQKIHLQAPDLHYYYMGYYIHTCEKMRYKGQFHPSDLLCPETYTWRPLAECVPMLDQQKYARLSTATAAAQDNEPPYPVERTLIGYRRRLLMFDQFHAPEKQQYRGAVDRYWRLVGPKVAGEMVLIFSQ